LARPRPGEQQVRDVRAGDEQHDAHGGEHEQQRRAVAAGERLAHADRRRPEHLSSRRGLRLRHRRQLAARRLRRGAGPQPADGADPRSARRHHERREDLPRVAVADDGEAEVARHHADDGVGHAVEPHRLAEYVAPAAEPPLPEPVAQHHHGGRAAHLLVRRERAAEHRARAEEARQVGLDRRALQRFRGRAAVAAGERGLDRSVGRDPLQGPDAGAPGLDERGGGHDPHLPVGRGEL
jgi:hypothetical protein